jgi:hypothetical protein
MPPVVRRLMWWFALPVVFAIGAVCLLLIPAVRSTVFALGPWFGPVVVPVLFAPMFVVIRIVVKRERRIMRAFAGSRGRACVNCLHDLNNHGDAGVCPGCGRRFDIEADRRKWARVGMSV